MLVLTVLQRNGTLWTSISVYKFQQMCGVTSKALITAQKHLFKVVTLVKIKKSIFLKNSEIPLETMPKNVI